jgi:hypothetical protein
MMNVSPEPLWPWVRVVVSTLFSTRVGIVVLPVRLHLPHARRKYVLCHKLRGDDLQLEMLVQKLILVRRRRVQH